MRDTRLHRATGSRVLQSTTSSSTESSTSSGDQERIRHQSSSSSSSSSEPESSRSNKRKAPVSVKKSNANAGGSSSSSKGSNMDSSSSAAGAGSPKSKPKPKLNEEEDSADTDVVNSDDDGEEDPEPVVTKKRARVETEQSAPLTQDIDTFDDFDLIDVENDDGDETTLMNSTNPEANAESVIGSRRKAPKSTYGSFMSKKFRGRNRHRSTATGTDGSGARASTRATIIAQIFASRKARRELKKSFRKVFRTHAAGPSGGDLHSYLKNFTARNKTDVPPPSSCGIIKSVRLFNFMCHESFYKEFHPNLNFIIGENGSGKSAILSGILVGLGARALTTSRTKTIKTLVKNGMDFAKTEITLVNNGTLSLETYGREFTIQRVIDRAGSSTYKISNGGKPRYLRRNELDRILLTLGIQLDNPVAVLNQETARSFLRTKDAKDKYRLFFEGTCFAKCEALLEETSSNLNSSSSGFKKISDVLIGQRKYITDLKNRVKQLNELKHLKTTVDTLQREYHWSLVIQDEKKKEELLRDLKQQNDRLAEVESKLAATVALKKKIQEKTLPGDQEKEELKNELRSLGARQNELQRELRNIKSTINTCKLQLRDGNGKIVNLQEKIVRQEKELEELQTKGLELAQEMERKFEEKKSVLDADRQKLELEMATLTNDGDQFRHGADECLRELTEIQKDFTAIKTQISQKKQELVNLRRSTSNKFSVFGSQMTELLAKVQAHSGQFRERPRGPLGACFTVKEEKWCPLIEHVLRRQLHMFVVGCGEDVNLLNKLIEQVYGKRDSRGYHQGPVPVRPSVMMSHFQSKGYDLSRHNASMKDQGYPTILDAIDIENDDHIVRNALCDSCSVERILLFEDYGVGVDVLKNCRAPGFPKNCIRGFTLSYHQITPDPRLRVDPQPVKKHAFYLKASSGAQLRNLKGELAQLETELAQIQPYLEQKAKEERVFRSKVDKHNAARQGITRRLQTINVELRTLSAKSYKLPDTTSLVEDIQEKREEVERLSAKVEEFKRALEADIPKESAMQREREEIDAQIQAIRDKLNEFENMATKLESKLIKADSLIQKAKKVCQEAKIDVDKVSKQVEGVEQELSNHLAQAEKNGARLDTARSPDDVKTEFEAIKAKISLGERNLGDLRKLKLELTERELSYKKTLVTYKMWKTQLRMLEQMLERQKNHYDLCLKGISQSLALCFVNLCKRRGYEAKLTIDHEKKELHYLICPDGGAASKTSSNNEESAKSQRQERKQMKEYGLGLSGGERSFSTICFIIAMWQVMKCPFYMLDEFDVFMDAFNRKASQTALISHALNRKHSQFFYFTPLELTEVPNSSDATVLRMFPPKRDEENLDPDHQKSADESDAPPPRKVARPSEPGSSKSSGSRGRRQNRNAFVPI